MDRSIKVCFRGVHTLVDIEIFEKFDATISYASQVPSMSFPRSQARDLQLLQGLFMKIDVLEYTLMPTRGFHVFMVALKGGEA